MPDNQNRRVESWELLNLAFMPRADALDLADRAAAQSRAEQFNAECEKKWQEYDAADAFAYAMQAASMRFGVLAKDFHGASIAVQKFGVLSRDFNGLLLPFERGETANGVKHHDQKPGDQIRGRYPDQKTDG